MSACQPIFATLNPLRIADLREILTAAGIPADPRIVAPEGLGQAVEHADGCLAILDGDTLPHRESLAQLCRSNPGSRFVIWVMRPTAELLKIALECEVHGLLSTGLPREEAATALLRICAGERILRFNADSGLSSKPLRFSARERHVLRELAEGADTARIAAALHTSVSAVKGNLSRLFHKTGARNRRELAQFSRFVMSESEPGMDATARSSLDALWMLDSL